MSKIIATEKLPEDSDLVIIRLEDGGPNQKPIPVSVVPAGAHGKDKRKVRMPSGAVHVFSGRLLNQAIANGGRVID